MAHDVFVSYPNVDKATADAVVNALESAGVRCWVAPRDVLHGQDWAGAIVDAIESARMLVLVFSDGTNQSDHILREVRAAGDAGLVILPFKTTEAEPTSALRYYIGGMHWLDAMSGPMEHHLDELVTTVRRLMPQEEHPEEDAGGAFDVESAADQGVDTPLSGSRWWERVPRRAWIGAGGVVAATLLVVVALAIFGSDGADPMATETSTSTSTEATTTTTAPETSTTEDRASAASESTTTSEPVEALTAPDQPPWTRVDDVDLAGDSWEELRGVAYDGARLVAVGQSDRYVPAVWGSADGLDWWLAASGGAFGQPVDSLRLHDVVAAGPGFVAVGSDRSGDDADAAVWTSVDGSSWTRRGRAELTLLLDQTMYGVTVVDSTIIAVGVESDGATGEAAVWSSEDGVSWRRVPYAEATSGWREMRDVAALPAGGLVAVGLAGGEGDAQSDAGFAVWLSDDGVRWERQPGSAVVVGGNGNRSIQGIAAGPGGLRAFGSTWFNSGGTTDGATWISDDGLVWLAASWDDPALVAVGDQTMADGLAMADQWVVVGGEVPDEIHPAAAVWILPIE